MAVYYTPETYLADIANAIRDKIAAQESLEFPAGFISALLSIEVATGEVDRSLEDAFITRTLSGDFIDSRITNIKQYAFTDCSFTTVSCAKCITIGAYAFFNMSNTLTSVYFPVCTTIGDYAFSSCKKLSSISFPACITIGKNAFVSCTSALTTINFPVCEEIGYRAFANCYNLTTVNFPSCSTIGSYVFSSCSALVTVSFPTCKIISDYAFCRCAMLTSVNFPLCTKISAYAFFSCPSLTEVSFPSCVTIGSYAFQNCSNLRSVYLLGSSCCTLSSISTFYGTPIYSSGLIGEFGSIFVPASLINTYKSRLNWSYFSNRFVGV